MFMTVLLPYNVLDKSKIMSFKPKRNQTNLLAKQRVLFLRKKTNKKNAHPNHLLDDDQVSQYLSQNPDFFIRNARQIESMTIPHPVRGVISLPEWQLARQRNKIQQLEAEITLLMENASLNEKLFVSIMTLFNQLLQANDMTDLQTRLTQWAKSLGLIDAYLYLFDDKWQIAPPSNYNYLALSPEKFDYIRVRHLQFNFQYLGQLNPTELALLIHDKHFIGSIAMTLLGEYGDLGVLIFASRSSSHYQEGQGTILLEKISILLPLIIKRWIARR